MIPQKSIWLVWTLLVIATALAATPAPVSVFPVPNEEREADREFWIDQGHSGIEQRLRLLQNTRRARQVVFFLGDGMGVSTLTAARIYKGQRLRRTSGEESALAWDTFPHVSLATTYGLDVQTSDSANTATAYLSGVKANFETLGVDSTVKRLQCHSDPTTHLPSIMNWAQEAGMWTGIVTTTRVTDATPAAAYAHSGYRKWQSSVPEGCNAKDIARQLIQSTPGSRFKVIMGGGRSAFLDKELRDDEDRPGERSDGRNLIKDWVDEKKSHSAHVKYIWNRKQLHAVNPNNTEYLLGLFDSDHLPYSYERRSLKTTKPSLPEMTRVALEILQRSPKGFILLVEGGRIDHAHHTTRAGLALEEMLELDRAVDDTLEKFGASGDTMVVVTADHSHTFSFGGLNTPRGKNILGIAGLSDMDHQPLTMTAYGNGPSVAVDRSNMTEWETSSMNYTQQAAFPKRLETHGGEDVAVFAIGPWAHLFSGVHDQTYIPHAIAYAACIGQFHDKCHTATPELRRR
ncbi:alkaline phosphatase [Rhipicephalus sanguineus]|uniref:alkaline phosphatase n=1 Tax=Rhipicephalus sanguineus TaxID=34632 RepID=UPI001894CC98|nr:alkaline phosphatase [Rhipicephalus sanguineus]